MIHVNTAHHRLGRIAEKTGCDLRRLSDVLDLLIATSGWTSDEYADGRAVVVVRGAAGLRLRVGRHGAGRRCC